MATNQIGNIAKAHEPFSRQGGNPGLETPANPGLVVAAPANPYSIMYNRRPQTLQEMQNSQTAIRMLGNHQLLMQFATENQQSIPAARLYWEKVASGNL